MQLSIIRQQQPLPECYSSIQMFFFFMSFYDENHKNLDNNLLHLSNVFHINHSENSESNVKELLAKLIAEQARPKH